MIYMCMCVDDGLGNELVGADVGNKLFGFGGVIHTGIDNPALFLLVCNEVGVFLEGAECENVFI